MSDRTRRLAGTPLALAIPTLALLGGLSLFAGCDGGADYDTDSSAMTASVTLSAEAPSDSFHVTIEVTAEALVNYADATTGPVVKPFYLIPIPGVKAPEGGWTEPQPDPYYQAPVSEMGAPDQVADATTLSPADAASAQLDMEALVFFEVPESTPTGGGAPAMDAIDVDIELIPDALEAATAAPEGTEDYTEIGPQSAMLDALAAPCTIGLTVAVSHSGAALAEPVAFDVDIVTELLGGDAMPGLTITLD